MTDEHEDVDDQAVRDARVAEFIRQLLGKTLDFNDVEGAPADCHEGPRSPFTRRSGNALSGDSANPRNDAENREGR
jgi:hypothetical protein